MAMQSYPQNEIPIRRKALRFSALRGDKQIQARFLMEDISPTASSTRNKRIALSAALFIALAAGAWIWREKNATNGAKVAGAVPVVSALVAQADISARLTANRTVTALQTVEGRPQISATIKNVHIREGQSVRKAT